MGEWLFFSSPMSAGTVARIASSNSATYLNQQHTDDIWLERTVLRQLAKCRSTGRSNAIIALFQQLDERWNGGANCIAKFGYVSESATY